MKLEKKTSWQQYQHSSLAPACGPARDKNGLVPGLPVPAPSVPVRPPPSHQSRLPRVQMGAYHCPSLQPFSTSVLSSGKSSLPGVAPLMSSSWWRLPALALPQAPASAMSQRRREHEGSPTPPRSGTRFSFCVQWPPPSHLSGLLLLSLPDSAQMCLFRGGRDRARGLVLGHAWC